MKDLFCKIIQNINMEETLYFPAGTGKIGV